MALACNVIKHENNTMNRVAQSYERSFLSEAYYKATTDLIW